MTSTMRRAPSVARTAAVTVPALLTLWWLAGGSFLSGSPRFGSEGSTTVEILDVRTRSHPHDRIDPTASMGDVVTARRPQDPPSTVAEIQINGERVAANTFYSEHVDNKFTVDGIIENGAGVDRDDIRIDVGDCALNPSTIDGEPVDRSKVPFVALYENVSSIFDLAEDDGHLNEDRDGVDCYVAELVALQDRLGNRLPTEGTEAVSLQTNNFGVDKQSPEIRGVRLDDTIFNKIPEIDFRIRDPLLASGDEGAPVVAENGRVTIRDSVVVGSVSFDLKTSDRAMASATGLEGDGRYTVQLEIADSAKPPNTAKTSVDLVYDRSAPTMSELSGPNTLIYASGRVEVRISGSISDPVTGVKQIDLQIWNNSAGPGVCDSNDSRLPLSRVRPKRLRDIKERRVKFDEKMTISPPPGPATTEAEALCVFVRAEDVAENRTEWIAVSRFAVDWGG